MAIFLWQGTQPTRGCDNEKGVPLVGFLAADAELVHQLNGRHLQEGLEVKQGLADGIVVLLTFK